MAGLREVYCASYEQIGAPVTESIVFIDIDGELLDGAMPQTLTLHT